MLFGYFLKVLLIYFFGKLSFLIYIYIYIYICLYQFDKLLLLLLLPLKRFVNIFFNF